MLHSCNRQISQLNTTFDKHLQYAMKQQEVFKKIGSILKELSDQYEYLKETEKELNDLELELFVANAHFLSEHSEVLRKLNLQNHPELTVPQEPAKKQEEKFFEPVVQKLKSEPEPEAEPVNENQVEDKPVPHVDIAANGADDNFSVVRDDEPMIIRHELELNEADLVEDEDEAGFDLEQPAHHEEKPKEIPQVKYHAPVKEEEPAPAPKKEPAPAEPKKENKHEEVKAEVPDEKPMTINQRISAQLQKTQSYSDQAHGQPITDLKQAINLNDKLLYIKDLFNGYNLAYSEAIDILNRFSSFKEAEDFLQSNYAVKNHWDSKQATADKLYALLRRRYV
ncbi:MAG: hypothetical protein JSU01_19020 [Bacteroidetes bacterium]|nr:hypothetical protein [Bacteroidota bacterium]